jgi:regulator of extracellular matrix RemA (YlzA/DUF370 family)
MSNKLLLNTGFGNSVVKSEVVAIVQPNSAPIKRFIRKKNEDGEIIDSTMGKKLRAVVVLSSGFVVLSAISASVIQLRFEENK